MNNAKRTAVLIPAYKPDDRLPPYVAALKEAGIGKIVIVDDGSGESFQPLLRDRPLSAHPGIRVSRTGCL